MAINDFKVRHGIVVGPDDFSVDVSTDTATFADGYVVNIGTDRVLKQTDNISELTNDLEYLVSKADVDALGVNAGTLNSITSTQFLRSDVDGTVSGNLTVSGATGPAVFSVIADNDNSNEDDTATIRLSQDGGQVTGAWGFDSNNVMYFENTSIETSVKIIDFRTSYGVVRADGNLIFHAGNSEPYSNIEKNKLSNIENNATADQTKFDIDALNIDADTLDGVNSSQFLRTDQNNIITAKHTIIGTGELLRLGNSLLDSADAWIVFGHLPGAYNWKIGYQGSTGGADGNELQFLSSFSTNGFQLDHLGNIETVGSGVWTGNGSGLNSVNATTLDGIDSSSFVRSDQDDTLDGTYTVTGDLTINGTLTETSSIVLKENVVPIANALATVLMLDGVHYNRKSSGAYETGLIAEEVEKIAPELVSTQGQKSIQYSRLTAYLIEAVKDLEKQLQELKNG